MVEYANNETISDKELAKHRKILLQVADAVAFRHFPDSFAFVDGTADSEGNALVSYPYVDRYGKPVKMVEVAGHLVNYFVPGKKGKFADNVYQNPADIYGIAVENALDHVASRLSELIEAMINSAVGYKATKIDRHGDQIVYDVPPNFKAADALLNRLMGKPKEYHDISVKATGGNEDVLIYIPDNSRDDVTNIPGTDSQIQKPLPQRRYSLKELDQYRTSSDDGVDIHDMTKTAVASQSTHPIYEVNPDDWFSANNEE